MAARKTEHDLTSDDGMASALNTTFAEFETDLDVKKANVRSSLIGRGIAIRNLRLREKQFARSGKPVAKGKDG